jgi:hypothetical protein
MRKSAKEFLKNTLTVMRKHCSNEQHSYLTTLAVLLGGSKRVKNGPNRINRRIGELENWMFFHEGWRLFLDLGTF